jgi:hypothetical protein
MKWRSITTGSIKITALPGPVGGFEKPWTFYEGDREAAGVGAA